jgi:hypothetical protein
VTHLRKMMLEELQARKITTLVLDGVEDSGVRSDSRGDGGRGSFSKCEVASRSSLLRPQTITSGFTGRDLGMELRGYNYPPPRLVQLPCAFNIG